MIRRDPPAYAARPISTPFDGRRIMRRDDRLVIKHNDTTGKWDVSPDKAGVYFDDQHTLHVVTLDTWRQAMNFATFALRKAATR